MSDPTTAEIVEIVPEAIPLWRSFRQHKPTLILFSQQPFLYQPPAELQVAVIRLVLNGAKEDFIKSARLSHTKPTMGL